MSFLGKLFCAQFGVTPRRYLKKLENYCHVYTFVAQKNIVAYSFSKGVNFKLFLALQFNN